MEITVTITIPESIAENIEQQEKGRSVDSVIRELVEEKYSTNPVKDHSNEKLSMADLSGMFSSEEEVDTARRHSEILRSEMGLNSLGRN